MIEIFILLVDFLWLSSVPQWVTVQTWLPILAPSYRFMISSWKHIFLSGRTCLLMTWPDMTCPPNPLKNTDRCPPVHCIQDYYSFSPCLSPFSAPHVAIWTLYLDVPVPIVQDTTLGLLQDTTNRMVNQVLHMHMQVSSAMSLPSSLLGSKWLASGKK